MVGRYSSRGASTMPVYPGSPTPSEASSRLAAGCAPCRACHTRLWHPDGNGSLSSSSSAASCQCQARYPGCVFGVWSRHCFGGLWEVLKVTYSCLTFRTQAPLTPVPDAPAKEESGFAKCLANGQAEKAMVSPTYDAINCTHPARLECSRDTLSMEPRNGCCQSHATAREATVGVDSYTLRMASNLYMDEGCVKLCVLRGRSACIGIACWACEEEQGGPRANKI